VVPQVLDRRTVSGRDRSARSAAVRPAKPDLIVDIKRIPELLGIRERDGNFVIGAATPGAAIGECEALRLGLADVEARWSSRVSAGGASRTSARAYAAPLALAYGCTSPPLRFM
jgi:FAD binding domain in molybdopterin dehydrogenase